MFVCLLLSISELNENGSSSVMSSSESDSLLVTSFDDGCTGISTLALVSASSMERGEI